MPKDDRPGKEKAELESMDGSIRTEAVYVLGAVNALTKPIPPPMITPASNRYFLAHAQETMVQTTSREISSSAWNFLTDSWRSVLTIPTPL